MPHVNVLNHSLISVLKTNQKRILVLLTALCVIAASMVSFANTQTGSDYIKVSFSPDRANSIALNGSTVKGSIYVHLSDRSINSAMYFLNTDGNYANSASTSSMRSFPQDFMYRNSDGTAKPFDTTTLADGTHTLVVRTRDAATGAYKLHTAIFNVKNNPDPIEFSGDKYIKVSLKSDRSNPVALDGETVSGNIFVHLSDRTISSAMYFLNTDGNYANSASITSMTSFPQDFMYRNRDGSAKPFDTKTLKDGANTLVVRVRDAQTGAYRLHTSVFVVNNSSAPVITNPTTTTPTTTVPVNPYPAPKSGFAGDVAPGSVRWGSAIAGNGDPVARHGTELANKMGIRRTFWDMNKTSGLLSTARADLAAGRLPWVSVKLNGSWKDNGDGKYDASMTKLLNDLSALPGPVWFTAHHEPEGGCRDHCAANGMDDIGGPSEWLRMQANTSKLLKQIRAEGRGNNIAFAPILMGWTFQSQSGRNPAEWYQEGIWDFAGIDVYTEREATTSPFIHNGLTAVRDFYGKKGLKVAIGEWGVRTQNHEELQAGEIATAEEERIAGERMLAMYNDILGSGTDGKGAQIIGAAYFDSSLNSPKGSWELTGTQLQVFRELLTLPTSIRANQ